MLWTQFGEVVSCVILVEKGGTGLSRGCAFVSFAEETAAHAAIAALDNQLMLPNAPYNLRVRRLLVRSTVCAPLIQMLSPTLTYWQASPYQHDLAEATVLGSLARCCPVYLPKSV